MKTIFKILFFSILISCVNTEYNSDSENKNNQIERTNDSSLLKRKVKMYSYLTGKVIVKNNLVRDVFRSVSFFNNGIIDLNSQLEIPIMNQIYLTEAQIIRNAIQNELDFGNPNSRGPGGSLGSTALDPNVDDSIDNPLDFYQILVQNLNTINIIIDELQTHQFDDCLEIKVLRPLSRSYRFGVELNEFDISWVYVVPHPISYDNFNKGYYFTYDILGNEGGKNLQIDLDFLDKVHSNALLVRPIRKQNCSYDNIYVNDFTDFLNN